MTMTEPQNESSGQTFTIRRSVTLPTKLNPLSTRGSGAPNPALAENVIYYHPSAKIVHFAPRALAPIPSSSAPSDFDYPVDTIETLPWRSATERTVATAPLRLERVHGLTVFLKCGNVVHAILKNSQCWCVDGVSKFVLRIRPLTYYRIEIPIETEDDKERVEDLKTALPTVLRYEKTPCPFKRAFTVELPEEATTPRRKKAWRPKGRKEGVIKSIEGDSLHVPKDFTDSASTGDETDGAATDDSVATPEKPESLASDSVPVRDLSPSPVNTPEPLVQPKPIRRSVTQLPQTFDSLRAKFDVPTVIEEQPAPEPESESESGVKLEETKPSKNAFADPTEDAKEQRGILDGATGEVKSSEVVTKQEGSSGDTAEQEPSEVVQDQREAIEEKHDLTTVAKESIYFVTGQEDKKANTPIAILEDPQAEIATDKPEGSAVSLPRSELFPSVNETQDELLEPSKNTFDTQQARENDDSVHIQPKLVDSHDITETEKKPLAEVSGNKPTSAQTQDEKPTQPNNGVKTPVLESSSSSNQAVECIPTGQKNDTPAGESEPIQITAKYNQNKADNEYSAATTPESTDNPATGGPVEVSNDPNDFSPSTPESFHSADLDSIPDSTSTRATPVPSPGKVQELKTLHDAMSSSSSLKPSAFAPETVKTSAVSDADHSLNKAPVTEGSSRLSAHQIARETVPKPSLSIPSNPRPSSGKSASPSDLTHMSSEFRRRAQATRQRDVSPMPPPSAIYQPTPGEETASLISKALTLVLVPPIHLFIVLLHIAARIVVNPAPNSSTGHSQSSSQESTKPPVTEDDFSFPLERESSSEYEDAEMTKKLDPWDLD